MVEVSFISIQCRRIHLSPSWWRYILALTPTLLTLSRLAFERLARLIKYANLALST